MSMKWTTQDELFMKEAIDLAKTGLGRVAPNPPVGCVIARDGKIVGRGWHDRLGGVHAEVMALNDAGENARGAKAYVTLSPCTSHGRQPPCTLALIGAGVKRVFVAAEDPNPCNCSGIEVLKGAGIEAHSGLLGEEAEYLARGFFKKMRCGVPYVTLKYAMTLDGRIATATGDSRWISCAESREWVHVFRSQVDAVMVGSGTALTDNPLLNVRGEAWERCGGTRGRHRQPIRVVVDGGLQLTPEAAMFATGCGEDERGGRVIVAGVKGKNSEGARALRLAGAEVVEFESEGGKVPVGEVLEYLGEAGVNHILCEGGGGLAGVLVEGGWVDEVVVFIAPKIVGGVNAPGPVGGEGVGKMVNALGLNVRECKRVGDDVMICGQLRVDAVKKNKDNTRR